MSAPEVQLLTEAEWREMLAPHPFMDDVITAIALKGLIAPEPVDPLLEEAMLVAEGVLERQCFTGDPSTEVALAALRRGMELQREATPPLTLEQLKKAVKSCDFYIRPETVSRLHAQLTGAQ